MTLSPTPSIGSNASSRSSHSYCEQKLHILRYELCLSCMNRPRSKSSGSLMSKIARKLGRISMKTDQESVDAPPTPGDDNREDVLVQSGNHTLQVPTPQMQQKKMKSMSTSNLERSHDR